MIQTILSIILVILTVISKIIQFFNYIVINKSTKPNEYSFNRSHRIYWKATTAFASGPRASCDLLCKRQRPFYASRGICKSSACNRSRFLNQESLSSIPNEIDAAYYLIHSMSGSAKNYDELEYASALNFVDRMNLTRVKQVIYLSGIVNDVILSKHLASRKAVEDVLKTGLFAITTLRAGIIVGSGSASLNHS